MEYIYLYFNDLNWLRIRLSLMLVLKTTLLLPTGDTRGALPWRGIARNAPFIGEAL